MMYGNLDQFINHNLKAITNQLLKLPQELGTPLFFGIFKKELFLAMMSQSLQNDYINILSAIQIITITTFVTLYIPCLASLSILYKQAGLKIMLISILFSLSIAIIISTFIAWV